MKNLPTLSFIIFIAFTLVFIIASIIFTIIIPLNTTLTSELGIVVSSIIKGITSLSLVFIWILIMQKIISNYLEKRFKSIH